MTIKTFLVAAAGAVLPLAAQAQIGAEAQGGKLTTWVALGLDRELSTRWSSVTDMGVGRHSDPTGSLNPVKRTGLFVLTQDFVYRLRPHWRVSLSGGYWRRDAYQDAPPYEAEQPNNYRDELRPYARLHYDRTLGRVALTNSLRTDYRFYFTPGFEERWPTPFEFRLRDMVTARFPLDQAGHRFLILSDEVLTATDAYGPAATRAPGQSWSPYKLTENRLSVYYRRTLDIPRHHLDCDLGLMYQYWRETQKTAFNTSFNLMLDVIVR
ncbi:DUF2490 domain-containing protein [Hymenobacter sp. H14-R3]|uniref:DUF2490 domain-containing protein n=1 Tax=Hymenobacter sp. H14-R3 TaxID=3046308 RepID=UPI0024BB5E07|nr:DUF2490 domain-containing protein [Hymenobacter sp. H14-R3]MDJ0364516.1 DUF2490 domain-containing protein [Hymenobacter sp. H14-R3]